MADRLPGNRRLHLLALALIAAAALAAGLLAARGGADDGPPASATLRVVPAAALVAVHLSTDEDREAVGAGGRLAGRLPSWPGLRRDVLRRLDVPGCGIDLRRRPGREITLALIPAERRGDAALPLLVTDAPAEGLSATPRPCGSLVVRRAGSLVVIGEPQAVLAAAEVADGRAPSLAADPRARLAARGLPDDRVLDAWVSADGARRLLAPLGGALGTVARLIDVPGLRGAAASVSPTDTGARIVVRRLADRRSRSPAFRPTLQDRAPRDAFAYVAGGDLTGTLQRLVLLLGPGAARGVPALLDRAGRPLGDLGDVGRESAVVLQPSPEGPAITLLARVRDPARARRAMLALETPLAGLLAAPEGVTWADARIAGAPARTITAGAGSTLAWALSGDVLRVSTSTAGIAGTRSGAPSLAGKRVFRQVTEGVPATVTSLVFLDPNQVLRLGDGTGGEPGDALQDVRDDLSRVRAAGAHATGTGSVSTVDLSLSIP